MGDHEGRGKLILDAARRLFAEKSFEATSTAEIATAANVAEGTIYRYFRNKRDLLDAVVAELIRTAYEGAQVSLRDLSCTKQRMRVFIRNHLRTIDEDRDAARLYVREVHGSEDYGESASRKINSLYARLLVGIIEDGQEQGVFDTAIHPPIFRDIILGGLQHCALNFLFDSQRYGSDDLADTLSATFLTAFAPRENAVPEKFDRVLDRLESTLPRLERLAEISDREIDEEAAR